MPLQALETQVAVVGAGAAGLYTALCAAQQGAPVTVVSARPIDDSSSYWAQGGLAAAMSDEDSPERHLEDTIAAGRGAVRESAARVLCEEAPAAVSALAELGMRFDVERDGRLALGLEGGHSVRRVVHAGGAATGRRLIRHLSARVAEHPRIDVLEGARAVALLVAGGRCRGVRLDDGRVVASAAAVLATGGAAALWSRTTNPPGAVGGGLLLALNAGATLADLEMVQFHPTAVAIPDGADGLLVTEAVRGEGARLLDMSGRRFVDELAPRDEVARAVQRQMASTGASSVALDMREVDPALFPNVVDALRRAGIDPERQVVPVAPAAHYTMGGIATDLHGRATLGGLYAVGESSCTGVHGANRLASNSLTECFVFGARAARAAAGEPAVEAGKAANAVGAGERLADAGGGERLADAGELADAAGAPALPPPASPSQGSREALWRWAGLERDADGLQRLAEDPHPLVRLIAASALARQESRGAHQRQDFAELDPGLDGQHVVVEVARSPRLEGWQ